MRVVGKQQEGLVATAAGFKRCRSISQAHYTLSPTTKTSLAMTNSSQQNYSSWHILVGVDRCFVPYMLEPCAVVNVVHGTAVTATAAGV